MKKIKNKIKYFVLVIVITSTGAVAVIFLPQEKQKAEYYKVVKVIDGDTIRVVKDTVTSTIRLIGMDTPETVDPRKPVQCYGPEASAKAKELLSGELVRLQSDITQDDKGKYGRLIRYVYRVKDNMFYNHWMIENGYAKEYTYSRKYEHQKKFLEAQHWAKVNELGLWKACN